MTTQINDELLSCEASIRWVGQPMIPVIQYAREMLWTEDFLPCPRALSDAQVIGFSVDRESGRAIAVFYLLSDPLDGIWPVPKPDIRMSRVVRFDSIKASNRRVTYQPLVDDGQLSSWLNVRQHQCLDYWKKWGRNIKAAKRKFPVFPPEPPRGFFSRLWGGR